MSAELGGSRLSTSVSAGTSCGPEYISASLPRDNLAGGTGVFANFFEEMAEPRISDFEVQSSSYPSKCIPAESSCTLTPAYGTDASVFPNESHCKPIPAFYSSYADDEDLQIIDQYKRFVNRSMDNSTPVEPYHFVLSPLDQSAWDEAAIYPTQQPSIGITDYLHSELDSNLCISYASRCKPPKVLGSRFLLGETIGRGSYGKVKDAVDLVTLRRHAVKIISKLGVRKIPGGWTQALSEANVMRRLPPNQHIVSLVSVLRLDNPDRLCLVMEHCLGSVHDLQAAGVPLTSGDFDLDDEGLNFEAESGGNLAESHTISPNEDELHPDQSTDRIPSVHSNAKCNNSKSRRFHVQLPMIATEVKQERQKSTDAFAHRKVSNIEAGLYHRRSSTPHMQQQQFRRLPEAQAHAYFLQLIDGLHFLHHNGVIHRDIKPANLLLTPAPGCGLNTMHSVAEVMAAPYGSWYRRDDRQTGFVGRSIGELLEASRGWLVKLTDFGVSASLSAFCPNDQVSGGQTTPAVQPPEVAKGIQSVFIGSKLDVYSAGVSLYFMLTGRVPFSCSNVLQIFEAIAQGDYTIPGHVSAHAANLVRKLMLKDPKKRFNLEQISKHPWVVNDPVPPMLLEQIKEKYTARPPDCANKLNDRGFVFWLDPLEFLCRPGPEFSPPHIDDTGARILSLDDLEDPGFGLTSSRFDTETGTATSNQQCGIAPLSVLRGLKLYHSMLEVPGTPGLLTWEDSTRFGETSGRANLGDQLARLGIQADHEVTPLYQAPMSAPSHVKLRHFSGGLERIHDVQGEPLPTVPYRQRGFTISLPAGSTHKRPSLYERVKSVCDHNEPPPCPADLPVSPPMQFTGIQLAQLAGTHSLGTVRTTSFHGTESEPVVPLSEQLSNNNQYTWHPGFQLGSKKLDFSEFRCGSRAATVDSGLYSHGYAADSSTGQTGTVSGASCRNPPLNDHPSRPRLSRRVSRWLSHSLSSLRHRFRNLRRRELRFDEAVLERTVTNESSLSGGASVAGMHDSTISEPMTTIQPKRKSRRWFVGRHRKENNHHKQPVS